MIARSWPRAIAWLAFLTPFFFLTYNFANYAASHRSHVETLTFPWEHASPFFGWTILPYWSLDILYAVSLGTCLTREEVDLHGKRLAGIQIFAVACFLLFPLRCTFAPPEVSGWESTLFSRLRGFDQPFNQAPSLHVALAVILWRRFRAHTEGIARPFLAAWFLLICASTLTTYQHQFIDVPTGAWAGLLILAALPERRVAPPQARLTISYLAGALAFATGAFVLRGFGWVLLWPSFALSMVAAAYWTGDSAWIRVRVAMLPYTAAAWINSRLWTRGEPARNHLVDGVWIGRAPSASDREGMNSVVDLAPEIAGRSDAHIGMLDLAPPTGEQLDAAVRAIVAFESRRPTLVCCALGYSRSAVVSAAWLIAAGHAGNPEEAIAQVRRVRPQIVLGPEMRLVLDQWWREYAG